MHLSIFTDTRLIAEIQQHARVRTVKRDAVLIHPGDDIPFVPLVQSGVLRIIREDGEGREIFLYHLFPGQICAMAINCCQAGRQSMVKAIAEDDTEVLQIPVKVIEEWFKYPEWKAFVNNTYSNRFSELIQVIDLVAFSHLDTQIWHYLHQRALSLNTQTLSVTHQQIADELHTHREAVSRLLRTMEQKNMVRLGRNTIQLLQKKEDN